MREKKFTKGPWFADGTKGENYPCISDDSGNDNLVAQTFCCTDREDLTAQEAEANANLIAAAPELLEALEDILDHLPPSFIEVNEYRGRSHWLAKSAIKKAYGE